MLSAGETEEKSYQVIKGGGTFAHILNTGTDADRVAAGQKGVRHITSCVSTVVIYSAACHTDHKSHSVTKFRPGCGGA